VGSFLDRENDLNLLLALFALLAGLAIPSQPRRPGWIDPTVNEKAQKHKATVSGLIFLVLGTLPGSLCAGLPGNEGLLSPLFASYWGPISWWRF
jgi:hypothetical protein